MNDFWKSYDITHAEYGADYRCYPLYGTVHLMELAISLAFIVGGIFPPKESIIVEKPPFSFASFMVFFIIALIVGARKPPGFRRSINLCSFIPLRGGFWLWS